MIPDPLAGAFERRAPAALALGQRILGALLAVDIDDLEAMYIGWPVRSLRSSETETDTQIGLPSLRRYFRSAR